MIISNQYTELTRKVRENESKLSNGKINTYFNYYQLTFINFSGSTTFASDYRESIVLFTYNWYGVVLVLIGFVL